MPGETREIQWAKYNPFSGYLAILVPPPVGLIDYPPETSLRCANTDGPQLILRNHYRT